MIGKFDDYFQPVLQVLKTRGNLNIQELKFAVADHVKISQEEMAITNDRGTAIFFSRVGWAVQYLYQAGALNRPSKGNYGISSLGEDLLIKHPSGFKEKDLIDTPGYQAWVERTNAKRSENAKQVEPQEGGTPQENIESSLDQIESALAEEIVSRIQEMPAEFLEKVVLELLEKMGYGDGKGSLRHLGGSGDEGVDGEIKQDKLGIHRIYIQAKRYKTGSNIGRDTMQSFMGALSGQGASGGIFITTSDFTKDALSYVQKTMTQKIVLINGEQLGRLLVANQVGTLVRRTYNIMEINENFYYGNS